MSDFQRVRQALDIAEETLPPTTRYVEARRDLADLQARIEELEDKYAIADRGRTSLREGLIRQYTRAERAEAEVKWLWEALMEKPNQPILNAARKLVLATDNAERAAAHADRETLSALLAVVRAAKVIDQQIWKPDSPDSEAHYQATLSLRDALARLDGEDG